MQLLAAEGVHSVVLGDLRGADLRDADLSLADIGGAVFESPDGTVYRVDEG